MFGRKYTSLVEDITVNDPETDIKGAKKMGRYKLGQFAVYQPDRRYLPYAAIETIKQGKGDPRNRLLHRLSAGRPPCDSDCRK